MGERETECTLQYFFKVKIAGVDDTLLRAQLERQGGLEVLPTPILIYQHVNGPVVARAVVGKCSFEKIEHLENFYGKSNVISEAVLVPNLSELTQRD